MDEGATAGDIDEKAFSWVARLDSDADNPDLQRELDQWLAEDPRHRGAFLRAQALWLRLDRASQAESLPAPRRLTRRRLLVGSAVAALAAGIGAVWLMQPEQVFDSALGEIREVPLADGSTAQLNTQSQVEVVMRASARRVRLRRGEAWFKVKKDPDRPFVVESGPVRVRAIGTAFSVRRLEQGSEVQVTEGIVEAWLAGAEAQRVRVAAGQSAILQENEPPRLLPASAADIDRKLAWRSHKIDLAGETLGDAVAEFNRYNRRPLVIRQRSLIGKRFYGVFRIDDPEGFARALHSSLNVPVTIDEKSIEIGK